MAENAATGHFAIRPVPDASKWPIRQGALKMNPQQKIAFKTAILGTIVCELLPCSPKGKPGGQAKMIDRLLASHSTIVLPLQTVPGTSSSWPNATLTEMAWKRPMNSSSTHEGNGYTLWTMVPPPCWNGHAGNYDEQGDGTATNVRTASIVYTWCVCEIPRHIFGNRCHLADEENLLPAVQAYRMKTHSGRQAVDPNCWLRSCRRNIVRNGAGLIKSG